MTEPVLSTRPAPGVALLTLNRPAASNALDEAAVLRLEELLDELDRDPAVRALVLTGAGNRAFCAGGDRTWFATLNSAAAAHAMSTRVSRLLLRLYTGERLVLAAIVGAAIGGGAELLTACHHRVAGPHASVRFVHAQLGLVPGWGGLTRLRLLLGEERADELLRTARGLDSAEAVRVGLVDELATDPRGRALELALTYAAGEPVAAALRRPLALPLQELRRRSEHETETFAAAWERAATWRRFA